MIWTKISSNVWELRAGVFRIVLMEAHRDMPHSWVMHIYPGLVDTQRLGCVRDWSLQDVQEIAIQKFRDILSVALEEIS